ncbi:PREDICTED: transcription factor GATA-4-like [Rhinopithecus bieti]|uniref:transcription factor GATA-4-like n=1 Tax=Rhinopithecus bieti TaxID=61621 RepID=UPI00083C0C23|nr:PREDICTED: transcription factor GATA-4-like [Rhinopithecus bieti]
MSHRARPCPHRLLSHPPFSLSSALLGPTVFRPQPTLFSSEVAAGAAAEGGGGGGGSRGRTGSDSPGSPAGCWGGAQGPSSGAAWAQRHNGRRDTGARTRGELLSERQWESSEKGVGEMMIGGEGGGERKRGEEGAGREKRGRKSLLREGIPLMQSQ